MLLKHSWLAARNCFPWKVVAISKEKSRTDACSLVKGMLGIGNGSLKIALLNASRTVEGSLPPSRRAASAQLPSHNHT
jgi:hypothetical protein